MKAQLKTKVETHWIIRKTTDVEFFKSKKGTELAWVKFGEVEVMVGKTAVFTTEKNTYSVAINPNSTYNVKTEGNAKTTTKGSDLFAYHVEYSKELKESKTKKTTKKK